MVRTDVEYRRPLTYRRVPYDIWSWISHVGARSFTVASEIRDGDDVLAKAQIVMVGFDRAMLTAEPLTRDLRHRLTQELESDPQDRLAVLTELPAQRT